jgi:hypothetical protein
MPFLQYHEWTFYFDQIFFKIDFSNLKNYVESQNLIYIYSLKFPSLNKPLIIDL